jgi:hypothetical protein
MVRIMLRDLSDTLPSDTLPYLKLHVLTSLSTEHHGEKVYSQPRLTPILPFPPFSAASLTKLRLRNITQLSIARFADIVHSTPEVSELRLIDVIWDGIPTTSASTISHPKLVTLEFRCDHGAQFPNGTYLHSIFCKLTGPASKLHSLSVDGLGTDHGVWYSPAVGETPNLASVTTLSISIESGFGLLGKL